MRRLILVLSFLTIGMNLFSQNPIADFDVIVHYQCGYATTEFINKSTNADTFLWDPDGIGKFYERFVPRSTNIGIDKTWVVTLIAKGNGLSDTISKTVEVCNTKIEFDKTIDETNIYAPLNVNFFNKTKAREGDTLSFHWDFGDGQQSDLENPVHLYNNPGTYDVFFSGLNRNGCKLTDYDIVIVRDTAQRGEFDFITSDCLNENETPPCGFNKHFEFKNDTLLINGYYSGNCATNKTATIRYSGDTIKIKTWEVGLLATCGCGYCFEIEIPNINQDSIVVLFNDQILLQKLSSIKNAIRTDSNLKVIPNPVTNLLTLDLQDIRMGNWEYIIFDINGKNIQNGYINKQQQIEIEFEGKGIFFIQIKNKLDRQEYITRFLKK